MDIVLASNNQGKIREFRKILASYNVNVLSLADINFNEEIVEDGNTFLDNALIKAKTISEKYNIVAISDDSGICIRALNNAPGVYSARYAKTRDDHDNNLLVLKNLEGIEDRYAYYECVIVVYFPNGKYYSYEGKCEGTIGFQELGTNGFGYDSLFYPLGFDDTFGNIDAETKNKISHRGKAIRLMMEDASKIFK